MRQLARVHVSTAKLGRHRKLLVPQRRPRVSSAPLARQVGQAQHNALHAQPANMPMLARRRANLARQGPTQPPVPLSALAVLEGSSRALRVPLLAVNAPQEHTPAQAPPSVILLSARQAIMRVLESNASPARLGGSPLGKAQLSARTVQSANSVPLVAQVAATCVSPEPTVPPKRPLPAWLVRQESGAQTTVPSPQQLALNVRLADTAQMLARRVTPPAWKCAAGRWASARGSTSSDDCMKCAKGKYSASSGETSGETCKECVAGRYAPSEAMEECVDCPAGTWSDRRGASICNQCPEGSYSSEESATSAATCLRCSAGRHASVAGAQNVSVCELCDPGSYASKPGSTECLPCPQGKYAALSEAATCDDCAEGKFSGTVGAMNESACRVCEAGFYAPTRGLNACFRCPPGSACPEEAMSKYVDCQEGHFSRYSSQVNCSKCLPGQYQNDTGQAFCRACPAGKYSTEVGGLNDTICVLCEKGKFGDRSGLEQCSYCPEGQYQEQPGQTHCNLCSDVNPKFTSTEDHTDCLLNKALLSESLVGAMFSNGAAMTGAFAVAAGYVGVALLMHVLKKSKPDTLNQFNILMVVVKSALPGFSLGSELFLIVGIWTEFAAIGGVMLAFRLTHTVTAIWLVLLLYGGSNVSRIISLDSPWCSDLRVMVDKTFSISNIPPLIALVIASTGDVTMVQFLPWYKSSFMDASKGFPSYTLMKLCMGIEIAQLMVSVLCQMVYLLITKDVNDPTATEQARALFGLNIAISVGGVMLSLLSLFLKSELLGDLQKSEEERRGRGKARAIRRISSQEIADIYPQNAADSGLSKLDPHVSVSSEAAAEGAGIAAGAAGERDSADRSIVFSGQNPMHMQMSLMRQDNNVVGGLLANRTNSITRPPPPPFTPKGKRPLGFAKRAATTRDSIPAQKPTGESGGDSDASLGSPAPPPPLPPPLPRDSDAFERDL
jgi:hypothetical protein